MHGTAKQEAVCQNENVGKIYKTFITQHSDFSTAKLREMEPNLLNVSFSVNNKYC